MKRVDQITTQFRTGKDLLNLIKGSTGHREAPEVTENNLLLKVQEMWKWVLGKEHVGEDDSFFKAGGNSLKAVQLASAISRYFNVQLSFSEIFDHDTIRKMALLLETRGSSNTEIIMAAPEAEHYPVSNGQKRLWVACQVSEINLAYNVLDVYLIKGKMDIAAFSESFRHLVNRYESLRTLFIYRDGEVRQRVEAYDPGKHALLYLDFSREENAEKKAEAHAFGEADRSFNLAEGPLLNMKLIQVNEDTFIFSFIIHHIITDGWSMEIIFRELLRYYEQITSGRHDELPAPTIQYKDYVFWQHGFFSTEAFLKQKQYWLERFKTPASLLDFSEHHRPAYISNNGKRFSERFPAHLYEQLEKISGSYGATLFTVLFAAVNALFYRYTRQTDIVIGAPVAARNLPDLRDQIGFFLNMLPIRTTVKGDMTFEQLLKALKTSLRADLSNQDYPFDELLEALRIEGEPQKNPLFNIIVVQHNAIVSPAALPDNLRIEVEKIEQVHCKCKYDMEIIFSEKPSSLGLTIEYNTHLYSDSFVVAFSRMLFSTVQACVSDPGITIGHLPLTTQKVVAGNKSRRIDFDF